MTYYILHSYMGDHHYVCVYGISDYYCHCMHYYRHHKHRGAHHYAIIDVLSDDSVD